MINTMQVNILKVHIHCPLVIKINDTDINIGHKIHDLNLNPICKHINNTDSDFIVNIEEPEPLDYYEDTFIFNLESLIRLISPKFESPFYLSLLIDGTKNIIYYSDPKNPKHIFKKEGEIKEYSKPLQVTNLSPYTITLEETTVYSIEVKGYSKQELYDTVILNHLYKTKERKELAKATKITNIEKSTEKT